MEFFGSWSVLTTNFLIVLYLALGGVLFASLLHLVNGEWRFHVRIYSCSFTALLPVAFILLIILLINGQATFPWLNRAHDQHLPGWHNYGFLVTRQIAGLLLVTGLYRMFMKAQSAVCVDASPKAHRRFRNIAILVPFAYVLYGSMVAWDFEMTLIPGWHSPIYAPYHFVGNFYAFLAFFSLLMFVLHRFSKTRRPFSTFVFNHLAQMLLAFSILWIYFFFSQYLIMWHGRLPEETERFSNMMYHGLGPLWWTFLVLKFVIPFLVFALYSRGRHNPALIGVISLGILVGTWLERYTWIAGSVGTEYHHLPMTHVFDVAVTIATILVCWAVMRWALLRCGLIQNLPRQSRTE